jgi:hypothetical protein
MMKESKLSEPTADPRVAESVSNFKQMVAASKLMPGDMIIPSRPWDKNEFCELPHNRRWSSRIVISRSEPWIKGVVGEVDQYGMPVEPEEVVTVHLMTIYTDGSIQMISGDFESETQFCVMALEDQER